MPRHSPSLHENKKDQISSIQLYNLYYLTQALYLLDDNKKQIISIKIEDISTDYLVKRNNPGLLYDIWLFIQILNEYNVDCPRDTKELLLDFLKDLQSKEGFFRANLSEGTKGNKNSYLLNTKMALDIFNYFSIRNQKTEIALRWIKQNVNNIINFENPDFISDGGFLYNIMYLENLYELDLLSDTDYFSLIQQLKSIYPDYPDSVEKFDTAINMNDLLDVNLDTDKKAIEHYLLSTQLKNGAFPLYGNGENADTLTTYLSIKTMKKLDIKIAKKGELNEWINSQLDQILKISM